MELISGIDGTYLIYDIIFVILAAIIILGVVFSYFTQKIVINYWLCILLLIRICVGLIQTTPISDGII